MSPALKIAVQTISLSLFFLDLFPLPVGHSASGDGGTGTHYAVWLSMVSTWAGLNRGMRLYSVLGSPPFLSTLPAAFLFAYRSSCLQYPLWCRGPFVSSHYLKHGWFSLERQGPEMEWGLFSAHPTSHFRGGLRSPSLLDPFLCLLYLLSLPCVTPGALGLQRGQGTCLWSPVISSDLCVQGHLALPSPWP